MAHDERAHPSDDPARSVERAEEREEDFDDFVGWKASRRPISRAMIGRWTCGGARGDADVRTHRGIEAKDPARAR